MKTDNRRGPKDAGPLKAGGEEGARRAGKKVYRSPHLDVYGDLRTFTLGGTPGAGDSGGALIENPFP